MTAPTAFTIRFVSPAQRFETYRVDDRRIDELWLPLLGPTPVAILRLLHRDCVDLFEPRTYALDAFAARLGVKPARAFQSMLRLRRFQLVLDDELETDYDHPCYLVPYNVPPLRDQDWRRLPEAIRAEWPEEAPVG